jgi:hypothetical protein
MQTLDVRPMAPSQVADGEVLVVYAPFEPVPLERHPATEPSSGHVIVGTREASAPAGAGPRGAGSRYRRRGGRPVAA